MIMWLSMAAGAAYVFLVTPDGRLPEPATIQVGALTWIFGVLMHIANEIERHRKR
jgi:hypothetical protein